MAKSTRKRVASFLADIANEDDDIVAAPPAVPPTKAPVADKPADTRRAATGPVAQKAGTAKTEAGKTGPDVAAAVDTTAEDGKAHGAEEGDPVGKAPEVKSSAAAMPNEQAAGSREVDAPQSSATTDAPAKPSPEASAKPAARAAASASRAPGLGHLLNNWGEQSREAEQWRRALEKGTVVQEIPTELITPFRWHDRFVDFDDNAEFEALVESILREGQIAPALLRPHPTESGRYELVYGHRRHRACAKLGRPLRAIVREMDDEAAVTFLSRENSQHAPPSFIERARQADRLLKDTGWTVQFTADVLGVQRSEVSRYRMVMTLPDRLVMQIGGDPTIGRPTWMSLETLWRDETARERISAELDRIERQEIRGARAMRRLVAAGRPNVDKGEVFRPKGAKEPILRRDVTASADKFVIDKRLASGFGDFLWDKLDDLWKEWNSRQT